MSFAKRKPDPIQTSRAMTAAYFKSYQGRSMAVPRVRDKERSKGERKEGNDQTKR